MRLEIKNSNEKVNHNKSHTWSALRSKKLWLTTKQSYTKSVLELKLIHTRSFLDDWIPATLKEIHQAEVLCFYLRWIPIWYLSEKESVSKHPPFLSFLHVDVHFRRVSSDFHIANSQEVETENSAFMCQSK